MARRIENGIGEEVGNRDVIHRSLIHIVFSDWKDRIRRKWVKRKANIKKYLMSDLRIIVGTIIHSHIVRTIPEKAVKMTLEITDDPRSSSTCGGLGIVKEDKTGGRAEREIESEDEGDAGGVVEAHENTMNTGKNRTNSNQVLSNSTSFCFLNRFPFYRSK